MKNNSRSTIPALRKPAHLHTHRPSRLSQVSLLDGWNPDPAKLSDRFVFFCFFFSIYIYTYIHRYDLLDAYADVLCCDAGEIR